jgi:diguanylate cyclase (GGDEF)-like protein
LVRFHSADPNIFYVYTMVDRGGDAYFVLDTAASPDLHTSRTLRASSYMERFELRDEYNDDWLQQIAGGKIYVTPTFEQDDYGDFLTAHAPIYDSEGRYSGFVGVDFDLQYYLAREARFRTIALGSLTAAVIVALLIGYLAALYYGAIRTRLQDLYDISIRDELTGLLNRRGAIEAVSASLARSADGNAMLLIDIDNLKMINDLHGNVTGDAVIVRTAEAITESVRRGDTCARLGGDEFMIFAPLCDANGATKLGERILSRLAKQRMPLAGVRARASIGATVHEGATDFARLYRDADRALCKARAEGKNRVGVFASTAEAFEV